MRLDGLLEWYGDSSLQIEQPLEGGIEFRGTIARKGLEQVVLYDGTNDGLFKLSYASGYECLSNPNAGDELHIRVSGGLIADNLSLSIEQAVDLNISFQYLFSILADYLMDINGLMLTNEQNEWFTCISMFRSSTQKFTSQKVPKTCLTPLISYDASKTTSLP